MNDKNRPFKRKKVLPIKIYVYRYNTFTYFRKQKIYIYKDKTYIINYIYISSLLLYLRDLFSIDKFSRHKISKFIISMYIATLSNNV